MDNTVGRNGLFWAGKTFYELDSYLAAMERRQVKPYEVLVHQDQYSWDEEELEQAQELDDWVRMNNTRARIAKSLVEVLQEDEFTVVYEHLWNKRSFQSLGHMFPQLDAEGNIRFRTTPSGRSNPLMIDGREAYTRDHKWAQRVYERAIKKMRKEATRLPAELRMLSSYMLPTEQATTTITERVTSKNESPQGSRHAARELVRNHLHKRGVLSAAAG